MLKNTGFSGFYLEGYEVSLVCDLHYALLDSFSRKMKKKKKERIEEAKLSSEFFQDYSLASLFS